MATQSLPKNPIVVEIGSYLGISTCLLGVQIQKMNGILFTIDNYSEYDGIQNAQAHQQNMIRLGLENHIIRIVGNSHNLAWPNLMIDLLFIDGDHTAEGVMADCNNWLKYVKPKGIVLFHDYDYPHVANIANQCGLEKIASDTKCGLFTKTI